MKKQLIYVSILVFLPGILCAQAAGNVYYNQKLSKSSMTETDYGGIAGYGNQATYQQQAAYNAPAYYGQYGQAADSVMTIRSSVLINVKPDAYKMILGLTQVGENMQEAHDKITRRIDNVTQGLTSLGISQDAIYIDFISQAPIFGIEVEKKLFSKNYVEVPAGFEVKKNLHLRFDDIENLEKIITMAAEQEIYDIINVEPVVFNRNQVYDSIRPVCADIINARREQMNTLGMNIKPMFNTLEEYTRCIYPIHQYKSYTSYLDHTRQRLREDNRLISASGNINLFYNGYNDAGFDKVINPEFTGPVVQFTMLMTMGYTLERNDKEDF
ncbi:MAG: SIMPL domain-containing protein [Bacteroidota bacterium]|nr:SIMPL domain-containing protein [Bacteroidota bacterium]